MSTLLSSVLIAASIRGFILFRLPEENIGVTIERSRFQVSSCAIERNDPKIESATANFYLQNVNFIKNQFKQILI